MSLEKAKEFLQKVESDEELRQKIEANGAAAEVVKLAASLGFEFSVEDLEVALDELHGDLSDEDLEAAAGGQGGKLPPITL